MHERHKIHLALPRHDAIRVAIENSLATAANLELGNFVTTHDICEAEVVISDSATISNDLTNLPESVRYLQLIDCGSGGHHATEDDITVANSSSLLAESAANWAFEQWKAITNYTAVSYVPVAGIIGFGALGYELGRRLNQSRAQIWINDIRTPRPQSFQRIGARRSSLDMLLSTSDVVFVAIHPGPTSTPLLTLRELRLLTTNSAIINLSGPRILDKAALKTLNIDQQRNIDYREMVTDRGDAAATERPELITRYILDNLGKWAHGRQPRCILEPVTHSKAGDPAFWSSRMHPRQTPV